MSNPQSIINICSGVKLNPSYEHTIYFASASAQQSYFAGKVKKTFPAYSYLRKSWSIKVESNMETAKTWTYLYFQNGTGKLYYYFITNIEYVNDNTVELFLELDVMQTYMFDYSLQSCFVEREHVADDTFGKNTLDEGLDLGEFFVNSSQKVELGDMCIMVMASYNPVTTTEEFTDTVLAANYNGIFSGLGIYAVDGADWQAWGVKLNLLSAKLDGIVAMWMYPKTLVQLEDGEEWTDASVSHKVKSIGNFNVSVARPTNLNGYTNIRNNKLLTYPYNFLYVTNNSGTAGVYKYEKWYEDLNAKFKVSGAISPEGSAVMYPIYYNNENLNYDEGITIGGFPSCAWNQDMYKLWLAQNQNQRDLAMTTGALTIVAGVGTMVFSSGLGAGVGAGMVASGVSQVQNLIAQQKDAQVQPPQARGNASPSVNMVNGFQTFTIMNKCVDYAHAKCIDDFFTMYGYKCNEVKQPNRNVRENWTYTKTANCHITGDICTEDQLKIESIYNNGVTFWKNGDNIGNYGLSNNTL